VTVERGLAVWTIVGNRGNDDVATGPGGDMAAFMRAMEIARRPLRYMLLLFDPG
jgi:hypothetical protein